MELFDDEVVLCDVVADICGILTCLGTVERRMDNKVKW